ncbi:hypothetical protein [Archangium sp. Cb G35]|uniref:hypothetical protein n=1 Tax=Archangium sp. Cb G35 TaxID=1920190 RepID=UPI000ABD2481|nr:hypothetical protein [Archangium sp. Cb G35]
MAAENPSPAPCSWAGRSTTSPSPALVTSSPGSGPPPFSIEQRYRYYRHSHILETISRKQEQQFIEEGCTHKLRGTIKPDIVLHSDYNLLGAALIIDLKFPCPSSNDPTWRSYGRNSAYDGLTQGQVYQQALDGKAFMLTPRGFF